MASDVAELQFMAQKDENIKTSDDEPNCPKKRQRKIKLKANLLLKNPKEEVTEPYRGRSSSN